MDDLKISYIDALDKLTEDAIDQLVHAAQVQKETVAKALTEAADRMTEIAKLSPSNFTDRQFGQILSFCKTGIALAWARGANGFQDTNHNLNMAWSGSPTAQPLYKAAQEHLKTVSVNQKGHVDFDKVCDVMNGRIGHMNGELENNQGIGPVTRNAIATTSLLASHPLVSGVATAYEIPIKSPIFPSLNAV